MSRADRAGRPTPEPPARAGKTASPLRDGAPAAGTKRWRWIRRIAILAVALAALAGARASGLQELLDVDRMRALVAPWGRGAPLLYVPIFVAGVLLHLPALALVAIGTLLFGAVWGFVSAWIGAVVGTALIFLR